MRPTPSTLFAVVLVALGLPSLATAGTYEHQRQGWLIGLGLGGGAAQVTTDAGNSDREGGFCGSLRVGYAFRPDLSLELNSNTWIKEEGGSTLSFSVGAVSLNYYPGASGLVLRGGVGVGSVDLTTSIGSTTISASESGLGLTAGAGYEIRVTRRFAIGPQVDYSWTHQQDFDTNHIMGTLGLNWYFIPR